MSKPNPIANASAALLGLLLAGAVSLHAQLETGTILQIVEPERPLFEAYDVSAVAEIHGFLVLGVDEGSMLQLLEEDDGGYRLRRQIELGDGETDIEGLASDGELLYVVGSHSSRRKRVKADKKRKKNRERLQEIEEEPSRDQLLRMRIDPDTGARDGDEEPLSLRRLLQDDPHLGVYAGFAGDDSATPPIPPIPPLPSKENGIDIEGLAVSGGELFLGFRGPVFRGGYVPVMVLEFDSPDDYELRFVRLGGRGIRSIARVEDGFLIVAGPVGDSDQSYRLYFWDGRDCVPGDDVEASPCGLENLGTVPVWADCKAEGLAVLGEKPTGYELLIVYDGAPQGLPTILHARKPAG